MTEAQGPAPDRGVYGISVAAELVGMGVQNLRLYEARGLLEPARTDGGTRRYSADDLDRLNRIRDLLDSGLNLAGIAMVVQLETENADLRTQRDNNWLPAATIPIPKPPKPTRSRPARPSADNG
jgi:MerR family transcriptional regulator, heat shock protein HspR